MRLVPEHPFETDPSGAQFRLDVDRAHAVQMPELKEVVGWMIGGFDLVKLMDRKGKPVLEFSESRAAFSKPNGD